jgi:hypothetical protein
MASLHPRWTHHAQAELDGVKYDLLVAQQEGEWAGAWLCLDCGTHGAAPIRASSSDEASVQAQLDLRHHHAKFHRPKT